MKHPILQPAKDHGLVVKPLSPAKNSVWGFDGFGFLALTSVSECFAQDRTGCGCTTPVRLLAWGTHSRGRPGRPVGIPDSAAGVATDTAEVIEYFISVAQLGPTGREAGCRDDDI